MSKDSKDKTSLASLVVKIEADTEQFEKDLKRCANLANELKEALAAVIPEINVTVVMQENESLVNQ